MDSQGGGAKSELESFRQQWISDLQSKKETSGAPSRQPEAPPSASRPARKQDGPPGPASGRRRLTATEGEGEGDDDDEDCLQAQAFDGPAEPPSAHVLADTAAKSVARSEKTMVSALDHYEEAMEKEAQGNMGDSLKLYRRAYRLDNGVDRTYREKHCPGGSVGPKAGPSAGSAAAPSPKPDSKAAAAEAGEEPRPRPPPTVEELIASFSALKVEPAPPVLEGAPPPPCPVAGLPDELLVHILGDVAVADVGDFVRLALVCKRFAYLVATEQRIWKRVCLGREFGFGAMHRHWQRGVSWEPVGAPDEADDDGLLASGNIVRELRERRRAESAALTESLTPSVYPAWRHHFRNRPRIRFNGCYISTVNYVRTGQASTNQATWGGTPIHIVTYYRYLRFLRDGAAISLLSTAAPADVVHHLTPELLLLHRGASHGAHLPSSAFMHQALRGRWRQSSALDHRRHPDDGTSPKDREADVFVETEGVGPQYMYRMDMSLRSAGKGARNNKLVWRAFCSYNKLTDDWAEFQLKHDTPFFFSRVKSYGVGGGTS